MKASWVVLACLLVFLPVGNLQSAAPIPLFTIQNGEENPIPAAVRGGANETRVRILLEGGVVCNPVLCFPSFSTTRFTVPAGRMLLIDYVSVRSNATAGGSAVLAIDGVRHSLGEMMEPVSPFSTIQLGRQVSLYAAPFENVRIRGVLNGFSEETFVAVAITGRLIDAVDQEVFDCREASCEP